MKAIEQKYLGTCFSNRERFLFVVDVDNLEKENCLIFDTKKAIIWLFEEGKQPVIWRQFVRYVDGLKPSYKPAERWLKNIRDEKQNERRAKSGREEHSE